MRSRELRDRASDGRDADGRDAGGKDAGSPAAARGTRRTGIVLGMLLALSLSTVGLGGCFLGDEDDGGVVAHAPTVSGTVTYDAVPTLVTGGVAALDYANTTKKPARFVVVEALDANDALLANTVTDATGKYALVLPTGATATIRVKAQMLAGAGNPLAVSVVDNTDANAQWATHGAPFATGSGAALTQDVDAGSGWTGTAYDDTQRAAGPFAILDTIYTAVQKVVSVDPAAKFPVLTVYWSPKNIGAGAGETDAEIALGQIGTTHFSAPDTDKGTGFQLFVLGKADNDTDEYDAHVVAHEFGHYLQSAFSRDDSIGGTHEEGDTLDVRVAFSEGWGNGWSGIALADPIYTDTLDVGQAKGDSFDVSVGATSNAGWFSEASVQKFFWDFAQAPAIGFAGVWTALTTGLTVSPALSSIHSYAYSLNAQIPAAGSAIAAILATQGTALPSDAYGTGESYFGLPEVQDLKPLYLVHPGVGQTLADVCVNNTQAPLQGTEREINRGGEFRFLRAALLAGAHTVTVTKLSADNAATTPIVQLYDKTGEIAESKDDGVDTQTLTATLAGGDYVLAVTDLQLKTAAADRSCFSVRID